VIGARAALRVCAVAAAIAVLLCVRPVMVNNGDASFFLAVGEEATEIRDYVEARLGEVVLRSDLGHDGRFFFVQANDPWVLDPDTNAQVLDRPLYRSQRMFYPLLASGLGTLGPEAVVWGMLLVNLIAMVLGSLAVASIAASMGMSPWWGLAFALNIGFVSELNIGGAGIVAAAAGFGAVALTLRRRFGWAVALLVVAALSREVSLIVAAGTAWWLWHREAEKRAAVLAISVPFAFVGLWAIYLRLSIGSAAGGSDIKEIGLPFAGAWAALDSWVEDPIDLVVGFALILIMILFSLRVFRQDHLVGWAFIGFVFLAVLLTEPVWHSYFDISRAIAPVLTAYALLLASKGRNTARNSELKVGRSAT
jgi:hypothetical protein